MKRFIIFFFLMFLVIPALAQVKVGVKAGGNYTKSTIPHLQRFVNNKFKSGFHAGVFTIIPASEGLFVKPELFYNVKGWRNTNMAGTGRVHLNYLSSSLLLGVKATQRLSFLAGPEVGYLASVGPKGNASQSVIVDEFSIGAYNRFEFGMAGGIAFQIHEKLIAEARYSSMFTDLYHSIGYSPYSHGGRNKTFQVSLNYILSKKSE